MLIVFWLQLQGRLSKGINVMNFPKAYTMATRALAD